MGGFKSVVFYFNYFKDNTLHPFFLILIDYSRIFRVKKLRLDKSLSVINELGAWIFEEIKNTLPKSQIGKAMAYAYARWDALSAYLYDGNLQIDNNLVENSIRAVALGYVKDLHNLGRKNYLFAGSHEAAQRAAMIYSFFAICK